MFGALGRSASVVKRNSVPVVCFGTGYFCCWTLRPDRQETFPQACACSIVSLWGGVARSLRHIGHALPDGATWPKARIDQIAARELKVLAKINQNCENTGLACPKLSRAVFRHVCDYLGEEGPDGAAVHGLAPCPEVVEGESETEAGPKGSGLLELVGLLDATAVRNADAGSDAELLRPMSIALSSVMRHCRTVRQQELGNLGILQMTRMALIASSWFADLQRHGKLNVDAPLSSSELSAENTSDALNELQVVWQELSQPSATPAARRAALGRSSQPEIVELAHDVSIRFAALSIIAPPAEDARKSLRDDLPSSLSNRLSVAMQSKQNKRTKQPKEIAKPVEQPTSSTRKIGKILEYGAWIALATGAAIVISKDGIGLVPFHVAPSAWQSDIQAFVQKKGIHIEELLEHHDPAPEGAVPMPPVGLIRLGPH